MPRGDAVTELVDGELKRMPLNGFEHGLITMSGATVTRRKETRMITKRLLFALAVVLLGSHALFVQTSPVTGRLVIPDPRILPGVPFDMWVELRNSSDAPVTVGLSPTLVARVTGGADFQVTPPPDGACC